MDSFVVYIEAWHIFYAALVGAAAALMGLIFLAVSLRIELFKRKEAPGPWQIAWQTFLNFFWVFIISITFLIPGLSALSLGIILAVFGMVGSLMAIILLWRARDYLNLRQALVTFLPLLLCYSIIITVSLIGALNSYIAFNVVAPALIFLVGVAIYNAWQLLFSYRK